MKKITIIFMLSLPLLYLQSCGPDCIEEERQLNDCVNLVVVGGLSCNISAQGEADAASKQASASLCLNGTVMGLLGCSTQVHPYCSY